MGQEALLKRFEPGEPLLASHLNGISDILRALSGRSQGSDLGFIQLEGVRSSRALQRSAWSTPIYNNSGSQIPGYGVIRIDGYNTVGAISVNQPNIYGSQFLHLLNGPDPIDAADVGLATDVFPATALYDSADGTPAFGEMWGPRDSTFKLKKNTPGFMVIGNADTTEKTVLVTRAPFLSFEGTTDAAIAKGASGTVSIFFGTGAGTDTGVNMTNCYNLYANVGSGKKVRCYWQNDAGGAYWSFVSAEC